MSEITEDQIDYAHELADERRLVWVTDAQVRAGLKAIFEAYEAIPDSSAAG